MSEVLRTHLSEYVPLGDYGAQAQISEGSLRWLIREHKEELVKASALIYERGAWRVQPELFDQVRLQIAQRNALRMVAAR
jgi:hypothetical protein